MTDTLARLISHIHSTSDHIQYCHVGNTAQHCRMGLFQDSDLAGDLEDSKSTSGAHLCIFGSRTFDPISVMCKKQTSVSLGSTESEVISLDASLRMDGIFALDLWSLKYCILPKPNQHRETCSATKTKGNTPTSKRRDTPTETILNYSMWITLPQTQNLLTLAPCFTFFEDNEAGLLKAEVRH